MRIRHLFVPAAIALLAAIGCKKVEARHVGACPFTFHELPAGSEPLSCTCKGNATGSVWGSDTYTADSSICRAAVHSGLIGAAGGDVTVRKMAGCSSYASTTRNGVTTSSWGPFSNSYYFTDKGIPQCDSKAVSSAAPPMKK
jgi:hypothetical protein